MPGTEYPDPARFVPFERRARRSDVFTREIWEALQLAKRHDNGKAGISWRGVPIRKNPYELSLYPMLYTLQFLRPMLRPKVMRTLYHSLRPGGCLIFAEKILGGDPSLRRIFIDLYHGYKSRNGYSNTEIVSKREALENVLIPFTDAENQAMLREAGFSQRERLFQWYNFAAYIAVKE
jgi:tRNA (cmo5U34)-methyltransferase